MVSWAAWLQVSCQQTDPGAEARLPSDAGLFCRAGSCCHLTAKRCRNASSCAVAAVLAVWLYYRQRQHAAQSGASAAAAAGDGNGSGSSSEIDAKGHKPRDGQLLTSSRPSQLTMNALKALQAQQRSQAHSGPSVPAVRTALWHSGQVDSVAVGPPSRLLSGQSAYPVGAGASASLATQLAQQTSSGSSASWGSGSGIVDIKPWLLPFSDLDLHSRVGDGSYGTVILAYWHQVSCSAS